MCAPNPPPGKRAMRSVRRGEPPHGGGGEDNGDAGARKKRKKRQRDKSFSAKRGKQKMFSRLEWTGGPPARKRTLVGQYGVDLSRQLTDNKAGNGGKSR